MEKETIILGAGESGVGAALLAQSRGRRVFVSDKGAPADRFLTELFEAGIEYEAGGHDRERMLQAEVVVKSPGIPDKVQLVQDLKASGVEVISEIEYAYRQLDHSATIIAITGSNGKTTTTLLTHHLLKTAGLPAFAGGNLGTSFARLLLEQVKNGPTDLGTPIYVLELSSFQLDGISTFRPAIAAILNITPDHLDRYDYDITKYAASKLSIGAYQTSEETLLLYGEDPITLEAIKKERLAGQLEKVSNQQIAKAKVVVNGSEFDLSTTTLLGKHNALNALFAIRIAQKLGVEDLIIQRGLDSFKTAPHRMEKVADVEGVTYINDSKATNVDAVYYALDAVTSPIIWIAGGVDKGNDYGPLLVFAAERVRVLICLGTDNTKLKNAFTKHIDTIIEVGSAVEAVAEAQRFASVGDTVLLSPACASFDLFKNYIDRGDQFRAAVNALLPSNPMATLQSPSSNADDTTFSHPKNAQL